MTKILIFTNYDKAVLLNKKVTRKLGGYFPDKNNPITFVSENVDGIIFRFVDDFKNEGLYFIYDKIGESTLERLSAQCKNDEVYALVHTYPDGECRDKIREITGNDRFREGNHIPGDQYYYYPVFKTLADNEDNKEGRIVRLLSPLKAKEQLNIALGCFDACLVPKNNKITKDTGVEKLLNDNDFGNEIKEFYYKHYKNGETFREYKDYFTSLKAVSDKVLAIIVDRVRKEKLSRKEIK